MDTYHNLTYKHTMVLKWFNTHCTDVKHLIKMDDDVFMNVPNVFKYLKEFESENHSVGGYYINITYLGRWGKWPITYEQWREDHYPPYIYGPTIIYSNKYAHDAYEKALTTRFYWVDDVFYTGLIRLELMEKLTVLNDRILGILDGAMCYYDPKCLYPKKDFLFTWSSKDDNEQKTWWDKLQKHRKQQELEKVVHNTTEDTN